MINLCLGRGRVVLANCRELNLAVFMFNEHIMKLFLALKFLDREVSCKSYILCYFFSYSIQVEIIEFPMFRVSNFLWGVGWGQIVARLVISKHQFIRLVNIKIGVEEEDLLGVWLSWALKWTSYLDNTYINSWFNSLETWFVGCRTSPCLLIFFKKLFIGYVVLWENSDFASILFGELKINYKGLSTIR